MTRFSVALSRENASSSPCTRTCYTTTHHTHQIFLSRSLFPEKTSNPDMTRHAQRTSQHEAHTGGTAAHLDLIEEELLGPAAGGVCGKGEELGLLAHDVAVAVPARARLQDALLHVLAQQRLERAAACSAPCHVERCTTPNVDAAVDGSV